MILDVIEPCLNMPYIWGGKNPLTGFDCSGLIEWGLRSVGFDPPGVNNAQMLHDWLVNGNGNIITWDHNPGDLVFYGKDLQNITHVEMMRNKFQTIGACGGDSFTRTINDARARGACVRINAFGYRKDLVCVISPMYSKWVLGEA